MSELPTLPRVGDTVDRYRVISEIAHGGMAAVYAVQRTSIGGFEKVLALKVMLPHLVNDAHFVDMFLDEARIASQIQSPHVVQVLDVGLHERVPFILMEFLRGQSLSRVVRRVRELGDVVAPTVWLSILSDVADGLHAAHETTGKDGAPLGIIHRDVTPHNVSVGYDGQVKVVDFGIAAARGRLSGTRSGEVKGKLAYLAPEQLDRGWPVTRSADIWSLGVMAWQILAGRRLFGTDDEATTIWNVLNAPIDNLEKLVPKLPTSAARVIMASLSRDPSRRPESAKQVAAALAAGLGDGTERNAEVRRLMDRLFGAERAVENERLAAALRDGPPPPLREPDPTSDEALNAATLPDGRAEGTAATQLSAAGSARNVRRSRLGGVVVFGVVAVALAFAFYRYQRTTATAEPPSARGSASPPVGPASERRSAVTVKIDERAELVRVNGTRHDERPLELKLAPDEEVQVEVVGPDGAVTRRAVRAHDDGILIALDAPAAPSRSAVPSRPAPPAPKPSAQRQNPLMKNPF